LRISYVERFQSIASNISKAIGISANAKFFAGPDLASYDIHKTDWTIEELYDDTSFTRPGDIAFATDHWYFCLQSCAIPDLMNHKDLVNDTASHVAHAAKAMSAKGFCWKVNLKDFERLEIQKSAKRHRSAYIYSVVLVPSDLYRLRLKQVPIIAKNTAPYWCFIESMSPCRSGYTSVYSLPIHMSSILVHQSEALSHSE
jgi:hypothetical protein